VTVSHGARVVDFRETQDDPGFPGVPQLPVEGRQGLGSPEEQRTQPGVTAGRGFQKIPCLDIRGSKHRLEKEGSAR
jgi:hypothetical protein